jgi:type II secretory ATPase GspE/PulE/Tfp pilus assembly ATPase PilB-like protein
MTTPSNFSPFPDTTADIALAFEGRSSTFCWPTPPFPGYSRAREQTQPEPCAIEGMNGNVANGRLMLFSPEDKLANVQVPPARTTLALRFVQFRALALTRPLVPLEAASDPAPAPSPYPRSRYTLTMQDGGAPLSGETLGHLETPFGLFLFPLLDASGRVSRLFVPKEAIASQKIVLLREPAPAADRPPLAQAKPAPPLVLAAKAAPPQRAAKDELLLTQRITTPEQLTSAIEQQSRMPMVRLGEALIALGMVDAAQLDEALEQQKLDAGVPIGEMLVRLGRVSREDLQTALARKMGYPLVDAGAFPVEADALRRLPYPTAQRLKALPLLLRDGTLMVAVEDPSKRAALEEIEFASQCKVVPVLARHNDIDGALHEAYARIGTQVATGGRRGTEPGGFDYDLVDAGKLLENLEREGADRVKSEGEQQIEQSDNSLVRLIHTMIIEAWSQGVSDIHIENYPGRDKLKIRFRKDGMLRPYLELPHTYRNAVIGRLKIMCDLDISERRRPQDGKISFSKFSSSHRFELRVATIPTNNGLEDVVMRLLTSAKPVPVDSIGLSERHLGQLKSAMERPYGLVLCVGPTGSGKTTTLHSALSHINVPERKIWTAEDPIEITQPGLRQVQVNNKIEWTFAKALRAFLRADPDVIMVGEIRDGETARTAIEASLTGHLVLSTLHTNSAPETVTRLLDMGMDPFNFADSLLLVVAQRLVRRLCIECRQSEPLDEARLDELLDDHMFVLHDAAPGISRESVRAGWLGRFGRDGRLQHFSSPGCAACNHTGLRGRHGIHEMMSVSREVRRLIQTGARAEELQAMALSEGMITLRQDGIEKVLQGVTTIDEVRATSNV